MPNSVASGICLVRSRKTTKKGEKKSRIENLSSFVEVKGWKAIGNKLGNFLRMSGFKFVKQSSEEDTASNNEKLDLFAN